MNEDRLLGELGDLARQEGEAEKARFDERWDRLAAGTLTAEEEAELKALADSSPEMREAYEVFRPLGADFQARVVSKINAQRTAEAEEPVPPVPPPPVLPFYRRAARRIEVWVGAAAAAAAALFILVPGPALPPLPLYAFDTLHGNQTVRGSQPGPASGMPVFDPDSPLTFVVRPPHPVTTPVAAKSFLAQGAELLAWQPGKAGAGGTFRFEGRLSRRAARRMEGLGRRRPPGPAPIRERAAGRVARRPDPDQGLAGDLDGPADRSPRLAMTRRPALLLGLAGLLLACDSRSRPAVPVRPGP